MEEVPSTIAVVDDASANSSEDTTRSNNRFADGGHARRGNSNVSDLMDPPQQASIGKPSLSRDVSMEEDARQSLAESARLRMEHNRMEESEKQKVTLDGLLQNNQYEHEATTHILTALEGQLGSSHAFETSVLEGISDEASKALEESSSRSDQKSSASRSPSRRTDDQDRKPLLRSRHQRELSVDDQLADLADQMFDYGFHIAPDQEDPSVAPHSDFDRNAQLAFGAPEKGNGRPRRRLFSGDKTLEPVEEDGPSESMNEDRRSSYDGVVDLEDPKATKDTSKRTPKKSSRDSSRLSASDPNGEKSHHLFGDMAEKVKNDMGAWKSLFRPEKATIKKYARLMLYIALPLVGVAGLLYYFVDNPMTSGSEGPSVSWVLLFVVRLWVTLTLALAIQALVIDLLCVQTRIIPRLVGPLFTLWIIQSRGWPFVLSTWSILNFLMLYGKGAFAAHWLFWQDTISIFNETNPAGNVVNGDLYRVILTMCAIVPVAVSVKRLAVGLFLGRQSFLHFGEALAKVMDKMLLVSQVAKLATRMEKQKLQRRSTAPGAPGEQKANEMAVYRDLLDHDDDGSSTKNGTVLNLVESEKNKLAQILDRWEEPERRSTVHKKASIAAVLRFRNALALIHDDYPFSFAFGLANKRNACIESAHNIFLQLLSEGETNVEFETIAASLAVREGHLLSPERVKSLIRVFRPNRDGSLSLLDFVKSVDAVYKEFRLLQASIDNSAQIDRAFEAIFNAVFYVIMTVIITSQLGFDPMALFLSLSSVLLAFAFVIGPAASKYFEGILFILIRRPYNIGDLINASHIESTTSLMGSSGWIVQNVTLFETTMCWLPTLETATVANGALASSRIVNWARSPNARFTIFLFFPIETKYETLTLFRGAIEEYMKARPRKWLAFNSFRVLDIVTDKGYMRVELRVQHREAWQNPPAIYDSRGNLVSFCNEVQKLLGMQYKMPPIPIDVRAEHSLESLDAAVKRGERHPSDGVAESKGESTQQEEMHEKFREAAQNKHKMYF
ncbi:unnamed protein product [Cylindrotheca closterium]|uniref:Mechanosensitive ion channel MscS domain-containing protein n=1 Tax=Cylindrotheca closterium TaxID=2856 RepID=A0AAD2G092_9STRA|nr:unnamed protein product [Cylindrotheca closterium]